MIDEPIGGEVRRDRYGRYLVVPPDGGKPVGYTRATTIAKTLDDQGGLMAWGKRMVAIGLSTRPDLVTELALVDNDDKKALDRICEKAAEAGGATVRRELGTAVHSIFERHWTDATFTVPEAHRADVEAVEAALAAAGLKVVEGFHERIVVDDVNRIAGTFDLLVTDGHTQYVADLKTGSSVKFGSLGFAIQLSIYANADALYTQGAATDGSLDARDPMPGVSKSRGVIIHIEPGSGSCDLHWVDLEAGRQALDIAMRVRELRKAKHLTELEPIPTDLTQKILDAFPKSKIMCSDERYEWLKRRVATIIDAGHATVMAGQWPEGVPTFKSGEPLTNTQALQLAEAIAQVEKQMGVEFPDPEPGTTPVEPRPRPKPRPPRPEEGDLLDADSSDATALSERFQTKPESQRQWVTEILNDCHAAGRPIHMSEPHGLRSIRRYHIVAGLVAIADCQSHELVQRTLEIVCDGYDPDVSLPFALGSLTVSEAVAFHKIADAIDATELDVTFGETVTVTGDINAALAA